LSANADDSREPEFDLMAVQVTLDAQVFQPDGRTPSNIQFHGNTFVDDSTVAFASPQGIRQPLRGCHDIVGEAHLSKVEVASKMKSKEVIAQCICDKRQKRDLAFDVQAKAAVFDLGNRQAGLR